MKKKAPISSGKSIDDLFTAIGVLTTILAVIVVVLKLLGIV